MSKETLLQRFADVSQAGNVLCFEAALPPIQSAIKLDGQGGARIQFDVPDSCIEEILKLHAWNQKPLIVAVVVGE